MIDENRKIELKTSAELSSMRKAGLLLKRVLDDVAAGVRAGISTAELDAIARREIEANNATPAFLGYHGFPATLCVSVNDEIVHGIPGSRRLREGDLVSIDCGLILNGFYADSAVTLPVGKVSPMAEKLISVTSNALDIGIDNMRPGVRLGTLSAAIQHYVESQGFSVVRDYTGHGIGRAMHEPPQVPNFGKTDTGPRLLAGMVIALEPMVNTGTWRTRQLNDGWTVVTADGGLSAHFEHSVAVTDSGPLVLTG